MKEPLKGIRAFFTYLCRVLAIAACFCAVSLNAQSSGIAAKDSNSKKAVDAARKALGGADKINGIKSLILSGTKTVAVITSKDGGPMTQTGFSTSEFEIRVLLPDNFFQVQKTFRNGRNPVRSEYQSFSKGEYAVWNDIPSVPKKMPVEKNQNPTNRLSDEMERLLFGALLKAGSAPLSVSSGSAPGRFIVAKAGEEIYEIEFDGQSHYPSIIRYKMKVPVPIIQRNPATGTINTVSIKTEEHEVTIRLQEWSVVDGIMFPCVITEKADNIRDIVMRIEKIQINPRLTPSDFVIPHDN